MTKPVEWLTINQAAELLGVGKLAVRRWISKGALPAVKMGPHGVIRIDRREVVKQMRPVVPK